MPFYPDKLLLDAPTAVDKSHRASAVKFTQLPISCGALLWAIDEHGRPGVILGAEFNDAFGYLPFKGRPEPYETHEQAAIREVYEETCGLVSIDKIDLLHKFETSHKKYYIGLVQVPYAILSQFEKARKNVADASYLEKRRLKFFLLRKMTSREVHPLSRRSIKFYKSTILHSVYIANGGLNDVKDIVNVKGLSNLKDIIYKNVNDLSHISKL